MDKLDPINRASEIGGEHGRTAAGWWEQDNIGGRVSSSVDVKDVARRVLDGLNDCDPVIMDAIPKPDLSGEWADGYSAGDLMGDVFPSGNVPDDVDLNEVCAAYEEAFSEECEGMIGAMCMGALNPDG